MTRYCSKLSLSPSLTEGDVVHAKNVKALRFAERLVVDPAQQCLGSRR